MTPDVSWDDLCGDLPEHSAEVLASHPGRPTPEEHVRNGATPSSGGA